MFESIYLWMNETLFHSVLFWVVLFSLIFQFFQNKTLQEKLKGKSTEEQLKILYPNWVPANTPNIVGDRYRKDHMVLLNGEYVCFSTLEYDGSPEFNRS